MVALLLVLLGCNDAEPWAETTTPFDPDCARCEPLGSGHFGHGGDVLVMIDPSVDDPPVQWSNCVRSLIDCVSASEDARACVEEATTCPAVCEKAFRKEAKKIDDDDLEGLLDAMERVFIDDGAVCGPPPVEEVVR